MKNFFNVTAPEGIDDQELDDLNHLITLARSNETLPHEISRMRDYLARFPDLAQQLGDLSGFSLQNIASHAAADLLTRESIQSTARELKQRLARPGDTLLEQFAIDQCVHAHMLHYTIELRYVNAHSTNLTAAQSLYWEKRLDTSQKRLLRALDNLARLRRFALPPIQINIAESRPNISTTPPRSPLLLDAAHEDSDS